MIDIEHDWESFHKLLVGDFDHVVVLALAQTLIVENYSVLVLVTIVAAAPRVVADLPRQV